MKILLFFAAAVVGYVVGGVNPAIILSRNLYKKDVRKFGSHNPGFTNFKRIFGGEKAWVVFAVDIFKGMLLSAVFGHIFGAVLDQYHFGAAFVCFFAILGHCFPVWYDFKGGKGVAVYGGAIWFIDWRVGLVALVILCAVLMITRYMSLSVICAGSASVVALPIFGASVWTIVMTALSIAFIIWRHRENIHRLRQGTESKFSLKD